MVADSGRRKVGAFCGNCGTRIYHEVEARPGTVSIRAGTLDDTSWITPDVHYWTSRKQSWVVVPSCASSFATQPAGPKTGTS